MCTCRETVFVAVDEHNVRLHPAIPGKHNGPIRPPSGVDCFREVYFAGWLWCSFTGSGISVGITDSQLSRLQGIGGEGGIRTLDRVVRPYNVGSHEYGFLRRYQHWGRGLASSRDPSVQSEVRDHPLDGIPCFGNFCASHSRFMHRRGMAKASF